MKRFITIIILFFSLVSLEKANCQTAPIGGGYTISAILSDSGQVFHAGAAGGFSSTTFVKVLKGEQPNNTTLYLNRIESIYSGSGNHILAKDCDGQVYAWGGGGDGQLGNGLTAASPTPVRVLKGDQVGNTTPYLQNVNYISTGNLSSYALLNDGTVMSWGSNASGRLGDGTTTQRTTPVYVKSDATTNLANFIQISGMENSAAALKADGTVWVWGANSKNECSNVGASSYAGMVTGLPKILKIVTGDFNVLALDENGQLWNWGSATNGMLGMGTEGSNDSPIPRKVYGVGATSPTTNYLSGVIDMAVGQTVSLALLADGRVVRWGSGIAVPEYVPGLSDIAFIGAGDNHSLAMKADGTLYTWGANGSGQLGLGNTTSQALPVEVLPKPTGIDLPCPVARLGPDVTLCNPITATLYSGSQGPTYAYQWFRDGVLLSNNDDNYAIGSYFTINTPGTYRVVITDTAQIYNCSPCLASEDEIIVTTSSVAPINANFCAPPAKNVTLKVDDPGNTFNWYESATSTTILAGGASTNTYTTPLISATTTYYVEDTRVFQYQNASSYMPEGGTGLTAQAVYFTGTPTQMTFTVEKTLTIKTVTINSLTAGTNVTIRISGPGGPYDLIVPSVSIGNNIITLNRTLGPGTYTMAIVSATGLGNVRVYSGASYPRGVTGLISFNNPLNSGYVSTSAFFNWVIEAPSNCGRIPVQAILTAECPTPVEMLSFTGKKIDNASHLFWSTAKENNSSHFEIQRSYDGIDFAYVGSVNSKGNSNMVVNYTFIDDHVSSLSGNVYYRLRQVDYDGTYDFTNVIAIDYLNDQAVTVNVYPNPVEKGNQIKLTALSSIDGDLNVTMHDLSGKTVYNMLYDINHGYNSLAIDTGNLPKGMYILNVHVNGNKQVIKVVVN